MLLIIVFVNKLHKIHTSIIILNYYKKNPQSVICRSRKWHSLNASAQPCQTQTDPAKSSLRISVKLGLAQQTILCTVIFFFYTCHLCLFYVVFVCAMPQVIHGAHANSISCHHVAYLFPFFAHSASDL